MTLEINYSKRKKHLKRKWRNCCWRKAVDVKEEKPAKKRQRKKENSEDATTETKERSTKEKAAPKKKKTENMQLQIYINSTSVRRNESLINILKLSTENILLFFFSIDHHYSWILSADIKRNRKTISSTEFYITTWDALDRISDIAWREIKNGIELEKWFEKT